MEIFLNHERIFFKQTNKLTNKQEKKTKKQASKQTKMNLHCNHFSIKVYSFKLLNFKTE